jgi:hypothetical protein
MKERLLKIGVLFFLVAALVVAGVYPVTSHGAAKTTTYNVTLVKGTLGLSLDGINDGSPAAQSSDYTGFSFKMIVTEKATTEKLKTGPATYYPVLIPAKSWKGKPSEQAIPGGTTSVTSTLLKSDAKGKLYLSGGDVDVRTVVGEKKAVTTIGDGKVDPANSLVIPMNLTVVGVVKETGKTYLTMPMSQTLTTGTSYVVAQGVKGGLNGKAYPDSDNTKTLPKPLVGTPLDLNAGTGALAGTTGAMNIVGKNIGSIDFITASLWVMQISK